MVELTHVTRFARLMATSVRKSLSRGDFPERGELAGKVGAANLPDRAPESLEDFLRPGAGETENARDGREGLRGERAHATPSQLRALCFAPSVEALSAPEIPVPLAGLVVAESSWTLAAPILLGSEAEADNLFVLTPTGSAVECTAPKNVFRVCFSDPAQGTKSAQYIGEHKLGKKVGVLYDSSDVYSSGIRDAFVEEAKKQGIELTEDQQFTADSNKDFSTQLQKLRDAGADLVFLPFYYTEAALVLKQANTMGYKPIFFGCDGMDGLLDVENFDSSLAEGLMLLTPYSADAEDERTKNFVKSYEEQYGDTPIQFAADAYDAVYAIKAAAEKEDLKPSLSVSEIGDGLEKGMTEIQLDGLTGSGMRWSAEGDVDKEPKAVRVENGSYVSAE